MALVLTNFASTLLATAITAAATTLNLTTGDEGKFPTPGAGDWFPIVLVDASGNYEIVRCTARAGVLCTIVRAQEGTAARAFNAGARVDLRLTRAAIQALPDFLPVTGGVLTGSFTVQAALPEHRWIETDVANKLWTAYLDNGAWCVGQDDATLGKRSLSIDAAGVTRALKGFASTGAFSISGDTVDVAEGGTGASTPGGARTSLDVYSKGEVNSSLALKAGLADNPTFNGNGHAVSGKSTSAAYAGVRGYTQNNNFYGWLGHNNQYSFFGEGTLRNVGSGQFTVDVFINRDLDVDRHADIAGNLTVHGDFSADRKVSAGSGLVGGGDFSADRNIALGSPGSITNSSGNTVTSDSHTHALGFMAAEVYTGNDASITDYPLGTIIVVTTTGSYPRNGFMTIHRDNSDNKLFKTSGGTALSGSWRARGRIDNDGVLAQRTN